MQKNDSRNIDTEPIDMLYASFLKGNSLLNYAKFYYL